MLHELERAATLGYSDVVLDTSVQQTSEQAFYRAVGYRETRRGRLGSLRDRLPRKDLSWVTAP